MFTNQTKTSKSSSMSKWFRRIPWLVIPVMLLSFSIANAQQLTGTLSGITADQTDARVPGAKVVVTNESTGDVRETKSDAQGFFSVTALIPARTRSRSVRKASQPGKKTASSSTRVTAARFPTST